ncbi:MAG TPA: alpha/beta hydrolase [Nocardioidaceae bacterium]|nr:alpha/beta hydrolase [Nocardioidaceae bacterium]
MPAHSRGVLNRAADGPDAVVRYGEHPDQLVDLHLPPGESETAPVLVLLHGGFWRHEWDRRHTRPMAEALRGDGWIVVTPEFRRTGGDGGWPATFDDIATVRERLPDLVHVAIGRRDIGPLTLLGHSAGGQLAMWWALTAPEPATIRRTVALAPVADLGRGHAEQLDGDAVEALLGGGPDDVPDRYAQTDPARLLAGAEHSLIVVLHGADDDRVPAAHTRDLPSITYTEIPSTGHFELIDPLSAAWPHVVDAVRAEA